jgi:hypothetical protein
MLSQNEIAVQNFIFKLIKLARLRGSFNPPPTISLLLLFSLTQPKSGKEKITERVFGTSVGSKNVPVEA